jgi:hypothetical protein
VVLFGVVVALVLVGELVKEKLVNLGHAIRGIIGEPPLAELPVVELECPVAVVGNPPDLRLADDEDLNGASEQ